MRPRAWIALALLLAACKSAPTTVLLKIETDGPLTVSRLVLTVFDESGQVTSTRLGAGAVTLPDDLVIYPRAGSGVLRLLARGFDGDAAVGEGATSVSLLNGEQVVATLRYTTASLPDQDRDGVPDSIDRCPSEPNPDQRPCSGADGPRDLASDRPADERPPRSDRPLADLPRPDQASKPDLPRPDLPRPDLPKPDLPKPDLLPVAKCAGTVTQQSFGQGMVGCAGSVGYPARASICATGTRVCTAAEWVARRNGKVPTHSYWTDDALHWSGVETACYVVLSGGTTCSDLNAPMRVCPPASPDPLGNTCKWVNCGFNTVTPNEYFGGCVGNLTAGALCCPK